MFIALSNLWVSLQNQVVILGIYSKILSYLEEYAKAIHPAPQLWDLMILPEQYTVDMPDMRSTHSLKSVDDNVCIYYATDEINIDDIKLKVTFTFRTMHTIYTIN